MTNCPEIVFAPLSEDPEATCLVLAGDDVALGSRARELDQRSGGAITKAGAILLYWSQLIPQIALGLALDWALIFAALFHAKLRDALADDDASGGPVS